MTRTSRLLCGLCLAPIVLVGVGVSGGGTLSGGETNTGFAHQGGTPREKSDLLVQYLEIVTPSADETCKALAAAHGVEFGEPIAEFGNARTADLVNGGRIGVRAPMRATEDPIVRPYVLVDDIEAALKAAEEAGATVALPPMPIPGQGTFSIYILGGIEHGLWQL